MHKQLGSVFVEGAKQSKATSRFILRPKKLAAEMGEQRYRTASIHTIEMVSEEKTRTQYVVKPV